MGLTRRSTAPFGDVGQFGDSHGHEIQGQGHGLAVEIAAQQKVAAVAENQRVVGGGVHFNLDNAFGVADGVLAGAVHLG